MWQYWSKTALAQVMPCCQRAPSRYLKQCWPIIGAWGLPALTGANELKRFCLYKHCFANYEVIMYMNVMVKWWQISPVGFQSFESLYFWYVTIEINDFWIWMWIWIWRTYLNVSIWELSTICSRWKQMKILESRITGPLQWKSTSQWSADSWKQFPGLLTFNLPGIPGACVTRNFTYLVRAPCHDVFMISVCVHHSQARFIW